MKLVQARVPDVEYDLLRRRAKAEGKTIQEWVRIALRERLLPDRVVPDDPLFLAFPLRKRRAGPMTNYAEEHDAVLYGESR